MSPAMARTSPPLALSAAAACSASAASNPCSQTRAPSSASTAAIPRPVPRHAPVTSATLSSSPSSTASPLLEQAEPEREHREPRARERAAERTLPGRHLRGPDLELHRAARAGRGAEREHRARERVSATPVENRAHSPPLDFPVRSVHDAVHCSVTVHSPFAAACRPRYPRLDMTSAISEPTPGRRERRRRQVHEQILDAAVGLFQRKGFASTTALEIADNADVAEKTFYNHFPTKQHLIEELAGRSIEGTARLLAEARALPASTADRLRHFCERSADVAELGTRELTREAILELVRMAQVDGVGPGRQ